MPNSFSDADFDVASLVRLLRGPPPVEPTVLRSPPARQGLSGEP